MTKCLRLGFSAHEGVASTAHGIFCCPRGESIDFVNGLVTPAGRPGTIIVPVMAYRIEDDQADDDKSLIWWKFSDEARVVMQGSDYFAALNRGTILALESRYACTLYERGCLLMRRNHPIWRGTVDELREVMGVPGGRYRDWADIRRKVVEPAIAEVNQLAHFTAGYEITAGPRGKVTSIEFRFQPKDVNAVLAAEREREASRVGRKARRHGAVIKVVSLTLPIT